MRSIPLAPQTANQEEMSIDAVMTTAAPTVVWDWGIANVVEEVLDMKGAVLPAQVPLLDSHKRDTTQRVIGAVRDMKTDGDNLIGSLYFAKDDDAAARNWNLVQQGMLTDVSIGYEVLKSVTIDPGKTKTIKGVEYTAGEIPLRISTKWQVFELSAVPIGADQNAKFRSVAEALEEDEDMDEKEKKEKAEAAERAACPPAPPVETAPSVDLEAERKAGAKAERERVMAIQALGGPDIPADLVTQAIEDSLTPDQAAARFYQHLVSSRATAVPEVSITRDQHDKTLEGVERAWVAYARHKDKGADVPAEFRGVGIKRAAQLCLQAEGLKVPIGDQELFQRAISAVTFGALLDNTGSKSLLAAYAEYPGTLVQWAGTRDVTDFKAYKDIALGSFGSMEKVNAGGEIKSGSLADKYETYQLATYGKRFSLTRQDFYNDDLGAFTRIPAMLGRAIARNIDDVGYTLLISNSGVGPAMTEDTYYLFDSSSRSYPNYKTGATASALGATGLNNARALMRVIRGVGNREILNLNPRYLLVPAALETTAREYMASESYVGGSSAAPATNVWRGSMEVIVEPRLDAGTNGTTAWYIICDPMDASSLVVVYLNGQRLPVVERDDPDGVLGFGWRVYHDVAVAAVDWRGMVRSKGAT